MTTLADKLGFGPKREASTLPDGNVRVTVTPPHWTGFQSSSLVLTPDQYERYTHWLNRGGTIMELLPELGADEAEILISGIGPEDWKEFAEKAE